MEPAFVTPMTEEELNERDDLDSIEDDNNEAIFHENITSAVDELREGIYALKREMFSALVSNDSKHDASELGAMMSFHSVFLHCISYWIGMLDSRQVPAPSLPQKIAKDFKALTSAIQTVAASDSSARVLIYSMLSMFSTQHPFDLGAEQKTEDDE